MERQYIVAGSEWWCYVAAFSRLNVIAAVLDQSNYDQIGRRPFGTVIVLKLPGGLGDVDFINGYQLLNGNCAWYNSHKSYFCE